MLFVGKCITSERLDRFGLILLKMLKNVKKSFKSFPEEIKISVKN